MYSIFPSPCNTSSKSGCKRQPIRFAYGGIGAYALHLADLIGQYFTSTFWMLLQGLGKTLHDYDNTSWLTLICQRSIPHWHPRWVSAGFSLPHRCECWQRCCYPQRHGRRSTLSSSAPRVERWRRTAWRSVLQPDTGLVGTSECAGEMCFKEWSLYTCVCYYITCSPWAITCTCIYNVHVQYSKLIHKTQVQLVHAVERVCGLQVGLPL